jgi:hypothetical protein
LGKEVDRRPQYLLTALVACHTARRFTFEKFSHLELVSAYLLSLIDSHFEKPVVNRAVVRA